MYMEKVRPGNAKSFRYPDPENTADMGFLDRPIVACHPIQ